MVGSSVAYVVNFYLRRSDKIRALPKMVGRDADDQAMTSVVTGITKI